MRFERSSVVLAVLCAGCAMQPLQLEQPMAAGFDIGAASVAWPDADWYRSFGSHELETLIEEARASNFDLAAAQARVRQADARARAAGGALLPQVDVDPNVNRFVGRSHGTTARETDWSALLSASYEVDFWGKGRLAANSAHYTMLASKADRDTVQLTTTAGVANGYFALLSVRERLSLARDDLAAGQQMLEAIQARFKAGAASPSELATERVTVATTQLRIAELQRQESEARAALAVLAGREPAALSVQAQGLEGLAEPNVAPGLPSELLMRRPDIAMAEANLRAAHADVAAARAALLPSLTLTASGGVQNPALQAAVKTLEGTGPAVIVGAAVAQTFFDGGRRRAARDEAQAHEEELLENYRAAILNALVDVELALDAIQHLDAQSAAQEENLVQSGQAFEGATLRYRAGSGDYLSLLDARRTFYAAREQMSLYRLARLQARVSLCKALGGGWLPEHSDLESTRAASASP